MGSQGLLVRRNLKGADKMITVIILAIALNAAGYSAASIQAMSVDTRAIIVSIAVVSDINFFIHLFTK